jgi:lysozyme family protein
MTIRDILGDAASAPKADMRFVEALRVLLPLECEFLHDGITIRNECVAGDSGGKTFCGLDQESHSSFNYDNPSPEDVWKAYLPNWEKWYCSKLPPPVGEVLFVQAENQGNRAIRLLQFACNDFGAGLIVDSQMGEATISACWKIPSLDLAKSFLAKSKARYSAIVAGNPSQAVFLHGWNNRIAALEKRFLT